MQAVVHGAFSLLRFTVPSEYPAKTSHPPHPGYFLRPLNIGSSALSLTYAHRPALPAGQGVFAASSPGMDSHRLPDDQPIFDQLLNLPTGIGIGDFIGLIGVQPDFLFATAEDAGGKPLLKPDHTHCCCHSSERKQFIGFKLHAVLRIVIKSPAVLIHPTGT